MLVPHIAPHNLLIPRDEEESGCDNVGVNNKGIPYAPHLWGTVQERDIFYLSKR